MSESSPRRERGDEERGSVTAELAVALPALVVILVAVLLAASAGLTQVRCQDAARAAARAAAIGDDDARVRAVALELGGPSAGVTVARDGEWVVVTVEREVTTGVPSWSVTVSATARAWIEPGEPP
ncbi:putative TadE-like family protein [Beutenbergia cavernae DSM 12333]|uniref:Putative TadE-like family protein n=1 Tax=Beutenbergia cavernae (strain ATCC BAA-8 / DSM 12333 / CCUG 43141 / JCM 11478 / NBRC 16432 / NCIMB 13614 / HKI 0122) TaxID=471853 RepID=C5BXZ1_BEUC1|nr:TadE family type IV pilus minor pilin [Beutenbergia cavernae]ACQ78885.1 putative TadE-like family protein [Beutenbergia cavernae DSM 12333]